MVSENTSIMTNLNVNNLYLWLQLVITSQNPLPTTYNYSNKKNDNFFPNSIVGTNEHTARFKALKAKCFLNFLAFIRFLAEIFSNINVKETKNPWII